MRSKDLPRFERGINTLGQEELDKLMKQNEDLQGKLTKRNEQYMMSLDKALSAANLSEERKIEIYGEMLPKLVEGQKTGQTARQLYGTVTEQTTAVLDGPRKVAANAPSKDWQIFVDGGLMMVALMSLVMGATGLIGKGQSSGGEMGLATLILNFFGGGLVVLLIAKNTPGRDGAEKKKGGFFRYILVVGVAMLAWLLVMTLSMTYLPASLNIVLPPVGYLIVAAVAFAGKWYFKKTYNVRGGIF